MNRSFLAGISWLTLAACGSSLLSVQAAQSSEAAAPAGIRIVNPEDTGVTWSYLIDGQTQTLPAGYNQQIDSACTITFDHGGGLGEAKYGLTDGTYTFTEDSGHWELYRTESTPADNAVAGIGAVEQGTAAAVPAVVSSDIVTPDEQTMFEAMYAKAGLNAATMKLVEEDWKGKTHAQRKTDYDSFLTQVRAAGGEVQAAPADTATTPIEAAVTVPAHGVVSEEDKRLFWDIYRDAGLDKATLKAVANDWKSKTSAQRKTEYEHFMKQVEEMRQSAGKPAAQTNELP